MRKGLGKNQGKGYKNLAVKDPAVHSMNAKGISQEVMIQPPPPPPFIDGLMEADNVEYTVEEDLPEPPKPPEVKHQEEFEKIQFKIEKEDDDEHKVGIIERSADYIKDKVEHKRTELEARHQARELEKDFMKEIPDAKLRKLAVEEEVKSGNSIFAGMFGDKENKYEKELIRREVKRVTLDEKLKQARRRVKVKYEEGVANKRKPLVTKDEKGNKEFLGFIKF